MADSTRPHVQVENLSVAGRQDTGQVAILSDLSFAIARGEVLALIGESGSGKTTAALSLMGYARPGCTITGGTVRLGDTDVLSLSPRELSGLRGQRVSYVAQSAAAAFNPAQRIITQVTEPALIHGLMSRAEAEAKARVLFAGLALPDPDYIGERFPHQVSGGQLQRLMAAMALITGPELVILDEPTTALDVTTQIEVLRAFRNVVRELHTTAVYVSHDLAVVAQMADWVVVLQGGWMQETAPIRGILTDAQHPYTRSLLDAVSPAARVPAAVVVTTADAQSPLLEVSGLLAGYGGTDKSGNPRIPALRDISFNITAGTVLGVIGESGCGKSTLARVLAGLLPAARGTMRLNGKTLPPRVDQRSKDELRAIQIVFQMADVALNPARTVESILTRPLRFYHGVRGDQSKRRVPRPAGHGSAVAATGRALSGRIVGRAEAAGESRTRPGSGTKPDPVRRGDVCAGYRGGSGGAGIAGGAAAGIGRGDDVHQPRSFHSACDLRPGDGTVCRHLRGGCIASGAGALPLASLYEAVAGIGSGTADRLAGWHRRGVDRWHVSRAGDTRFTGCMPVLPALRGAHPRTL